MADIPVALQLYTVRDETARDFVGTLRKVAEIGYKGVEFAGTGGMEASALRQLLLDLNLQAAGSRVALVHLKDMANDESRTFAEVGTGRMDFDSIFIASEAAGVEWFIVEQDKCQRPALASAALSLDYLRRKGIA